MSSLRRVGWWLWPMLVGLVTIWSVYAIADGYLGKLHLELGSMSFPRNADVRFWFLWSTLGFVAAGGIGLGIARLASVHRAARRILLLVPQTPDVTIIAFATLAAFLIPFAVRMLALGDAVIADDESCYQFQAQLIGQLRLSVPSPPSKLFFDRTFMINDGRLYAMYFVGWPALMAPFAKIGAAGYANAFYNAVTAPAIFLVARRLAGSSAARAAIVLFCFAPVLAFGAATYMSNTTCVMALAWMTWLWMRTKEDDAPLWTHAGVAALFGLAFLIRPTPTLGIGLPVLVAWIVGVMRGPKENRARAAASFVATGAAFALIFLLVNKAETGHFTQTAYAREFEYAKENQLRFNNWGVPGFREHVDEMKPHFALGRSFPRTIAATIFAWLRFDIAMFGWPLSSIFLPFTFGAKNTRVLWAMVACNLVVHFPVLDAGIDLYGPHHYIELALPVLLLTAVGIARLSRFLARLAPYLKKTGTLLRPGLLPSSLVVGLVVTTLSVHIPARVSAMARGAEDVNRPAETLALNNVHNAVIFSWRPFTSSFALCDRENPGHYVYWRPNNDPDLKNDILWVNHISVDADRDFMKNFPERRGLVMMYDVATCQLTFVPLEKATPEKVPDGDVDGDNRGRVGFDYWPKHGMSPPLR